MSSGAIYQPPIENLSQFNSTVFKPTNLSQIQASSLYLGRVGNPTSVATSTTFTGSLIGNNGLNITSGTTNLQALTTPAITLNTYPLGQNNGSFYFGALQSGTNSTQYGFPSSNTQGSYVVSEGAYANCQGAGSTAIGCYTNCNTATYSVAIGYNAQVNSGLNNAIAIGSSAVATLSNQLVLGQAGTTTYSQAIQNNGNLNFMNSTSTNNTITGLNNIIYDNTLGGKAVLYNSGVSSTNYEMGLDSYTLYFNSPANTNFYGAGSSSTPMLSITPTLISISTPIQLQTTYSAPATSLQLGYKFNYQSLATALTSTVVSQLILVPVPVGVWSVSYSVSCLATGAGNITAQNIVFSYTSASITALSVISGQIKKHNSETYALNDVYIVSSCFTFQTTSAVNIYLNMVSTFGGGAGVTATGYVSLTRIG